MPALTDWQYLKGTDCIYMKIYICAQLDQSPFPNCPGQRTDYESYYYKCVTEGRITAEGLLLWRTLPIDWGVEIQRLGIIRRRLDSLDEQ